MAPIVVGKILTDPGLSQVGTFRADADSITIDVADARAEAKIRRNMGKRWLIEENPTIAGGTITDRGAFVKPENEKTLPSFFAMLDSIGFVATDVENIEQEEG